MTVKVWLGTRAVSGVKVRVEGGRHVFVGGTGVLVGGTGIGVEVGVRMGVSVGTVDATIDTGVSVEAAMKPTPHLSHAGRLRHRLPAGLPRCK